MTREEEILNLLLSRYERSGHCLPGKETKKRVMLNLSRGDLDCYRENDPSIADINSAIEILISEGIVSALWRKGYEGWLYGRVILNLDELDRAYARVCREPLSRMADTIYRVLCQAAPQLHTAWKLRFLEDESKLLLVNLRPSRLLPMNEALVWSIMKVLCYTENGPELMRVISASCFRDSKYLEQNILSHLISIAKVYEPELAAYRFLGDEHLTKNVVLEQIGILPYPEIIEFCGNILLSFKNTALNTGVFQNGFCIQSENLRFLTGVDISSIKKILFVENRTNYRHAVLRGVQDDTLVIYHGGFYSPAKRRLFSLLSENMTYASQVVFWGDIDLGGFLMFTRLKREFFPNLTPWRMGIEDFEEYKDHGVKRPIDYVEMLRRKVDEEQFDSCFVPVAHAILKTGVTVEQEIML